MNNTTPNTPDDAFESVSAADNRLIRKIVDRAFTNYPTLRKSARMDLEMDLIACHMIGCKLDLQRLLDAPRLLDFAHDVFGIHHHIDRDTGRLTGMFLPRYATVREIVRQQVEAVPQ